MPNAPPPPATGDKNPPDAGVKPPQPRAFNVPPVTLTAAGLLIAAFAILTLMPVAWTVGIIEMFAVRPIAVAAALRDPLQFQSAIAALTLVTYALIHIDGIHVALNVGFLLAFGGGCERLFGRRRFVAILILSAIAGAAAKLAVDWNAPVVMYGASGAVFGCMGAFIRLMIGGPPQLRRRGLILLLSLVVANGIVTLVGPQIFGVEASIAWDAHVGGFVAGVLLGWRPRPRVAPAAV